jgi:hypothetical protein
MAYTISSLLPTLCYRLHIVILCHFFVKVTGSQIITGIVYILHTQKFSFFTAF